MHTSSLQQLMSYSGRPVKVVEIEEIYKGRLVLLSVQPLHATAEKSSPDTRPRFSSPETKNSKVHTVTRSALLFRWRIFAPMQQSRKERMNHNGRPERMRCLGPPFLIVSHCKLHSSLIAKILSADLVMRKDHSVVLTPLGYFRATRVQSIMVSKGQS